MSALFAQMSDMNEGLSFVAIILITIAVSVGFGALMYWKLFEKAGQPAWASIVPIYQTVVLAQVAKKPIWWGLVAALAGFIPFVGGIIAIVFMILLAIEVCKRFGKPGAGMVILCLICGIGYMILGFGDARYEDDLDHDQAF